MLTNVPPVPVVYGSDFSVAPATGIPSLIVYDTIAGCQYRLVFTENLGSGVWAPVLFPLPDGWMPGGGAITFTDPDAPGKPRRFYRVEARGL